jgi:Nucleotide modification associated domain 2
MAIFSYVLVYDTGFAPNPFGGFCTLATCKPKIRLKARVGDWVIGTGSTRGVGHRRLVYAMRISEIVPLEIYGSDPSFASKRPKFDGAHWRQFGDSIYYRNKQGAWQQRPSQHGTEEMDRDLRGENVLMAEEFYYFGQKAVPLPSELLPLVKKGPGHRRCTEPQLEERLASWLRSTFPAGKLGEPEDSAPAKTEICRRRPRRRTC